MSMHEPATTDDPVTFVNIFEIPPGEVEQFISGWRDRAQLMSHTPGFHRAQLLRATSPDTHFQLINIAHWDSAEAWTAATATGEFRSRGGRRRRRATREVIEANSGPSPPAGPDRGGSLRGRARIRRGGLGAALLPWVQPAVVRARPRPLGLEHRQRELTIRTLEREGWISTGPEARSMRPGPRAHLSSPSESDA
jgi:heme-degrading monooxygenase HmoA